MRLNFYEIESKVKSLFVDKLGVDASQVTFEANFTNDLGMDSLDTVEMIMEVEKEFNINITDEMAETMGPTLGDAFKNFIQNAPREILPVISSRVLSFRFNQKGQVEAFLRLEDGSWCFADGSTLLPSSICLLTFSKWSNILNELEEIINDPNTKESDVQHFFESYPELLAGNDYDVVLPQAVIVKDDNSEWKPDFVLTPKNQTDFAKVLDLKIPSLSVHNRPQSGHLTFSAKLWAGLMQVRDYSREFDKTTVRDRFKNEYQVDVFKPDLHLIAGRKWDVMLNERMKELMRETPVKLEDWDSALERLRRNFT